MAEGIKLIANNKKAYFDYFILEKYEAGIELFGTEVKSVRLGHCSVKESFVRIDKAQVYIYGMHISPYEKGNIFNKDPLRVRRLLLHKTEIIKLASKLKEKGLTLVPLRVYFHLGGIPLKDDLILLFFYQYHSNSKKNYDKRDSIAKKDQQRDIDRSLKNIK